MRRGVNFPAKFDMKQEGDAGGGGWGGGWGVHTWKWPLD